MHTDVLTRTGGWHYIDGSTIVPDVKGALGYINVKEFGAKGDGVTDDTAAIQAALDVAGATGTTASRTTVIIPPGNYKITATLTVYGGGVRVLGVSSFVDATGRGSALVAGTAGMTLLQVGRLTPSALYVDRAEIANLRLTGNSNGATGLFVLNTHYSRFQDIEVSGFSGDGIKIDGEIFGVTFDQVRSVSNNVGWNITRTNLTIQKLYCYNCSGISNTTKQIMLTGGVEQTAFFGGEFQGGTVGAYFSNAEGSGWYGVQFEASSVAAVQFAKPAGAADTGHGAARVSFDNCMFRGDSITPYAFVSNGATRISISNIDSATHTAGTFNFSNTGVTNALNHTNMLWGANNLADGGTNVLDGVLWAPADSASGVGALLAIGVPTTVIAGTVLGITGNLFQNGASPRHYLREASQAADNRLWEWTIEGLVLKGRVLSDSLGTATPWVQVTRSGTAISLVGLAGPVQVTPSGTGAGQTGELRFLELAANGTNYQALKALDALSSNITFSLPIATTSYANPNVYGAIYVGTGGALYVSTG